MLVKTIAALRLKNGYTHGDTFMCIANSTVYEYDATSQAVDDGVNVIRPVLTDAGRWLKLVRMRKYAETAPAAVTVAADTITATSARLKGTITAYDAATTVSFQWGDDDTYGAESETGGTIAATPEIVNGDGATSVTAALTELTIEEGTYHFRVVAVNEAGTTYGDDEEFTTLAA